jgi:hypothetical protein
MPLMETIDIHRENLTNNKEKLCGKLWIFLMLEQVMHDFKLGCKLLIEVLWFLCSELFILMLDMLLVANNPKDSQIALPVGLLL